MKIQDAIVIVIERYLFSLFQASQSATINAQRIKIGSPRVKPKLINIEALRIGQYF